MTNLVSKNSSAIQQDKDQMKNLLQNVRKNLDTTIEKDRIEIYAMKQAGIEQNKIAVKLGVHPRFSTYEIQKNAKRTQC